MPAILCLYVHQLNTHSSCTLKAFCTWLVLQIGRCLISCEGPMKYTSICLSVCLSMSGRNVSLYHLAPLHVTLGFHFSLFTPSSAMTWNVKYFLNCTKIPLASLKWIFIGVWTITFFFLLNILWTKEILHQFTEQRPYWLLTGTSLLLPHINSQQTEVVDSWPSFISSSSSK